MFTGLVEEEGIVQRIDRRRGSILFTVRAGRQFCNLKTDESVSLNGVCLTVIRSSGRTFTVQAVEETLKKTNLGGLACGALVNLELPLTLHARIGGHFVLGHVDG